MNSHRDISDCHAPFDRESRFGDQLAGVDADDADAENALRLRIDLVRPVLSPSVAARPDAC